MKKLYQIISFTFVYTFPFPVICYYLDEILKSELLTFFLSIYCLFMGVIGLIAVTHLVKEMKKRGVAL